MRDQKSAARIQPHTDEARSPDLWRRCCPSFMALELLDKAVICRQGDEGHTVFYLVKGFVKLSRVTENGDQLTTAILTEGDVFGASFIGTTGTMIEDTAMAKGPIRVFRVKPEEFRNLVSQHSNIAWELIMRLTSRQLQVYHKMESILFKEVRARVAETILELAGAYGENCHHGYELDIPLNQSELADLVGASRPVVSTILNKLRTQDILEYGREYICIKRRTELERLIIL